MVAGLLLVSLQSLNYSGSHPFAQLPLRRGQWRNRESSFFGAAQRLKNVPVKMAVFLALLETEEVCFLAFVGMHMSIVMYC